MDDKNKKSRAERERELQAMAGTEQGKTIIRRLWLRALGLQPGQMGPAGTLIRQQMIPAILEHEYGGAIAMGTCATCGGTGKCSTCEGVGKIVEKGPPQAGVMPDPTPTCPACGGTGKCPTCKGGSGGATMPEIIGVE